MNKKKYLLFVLLGLMCSSTLIILSINLPTNKNNTEVCEIKKWGPKKIKFGVKFHQQPTGQSAFWVTSQCASESTVLRFNGHILKTTLKLPSVTAAIDDDILISKPGSYTLELFNTVTKEATKVGDFIVEPNKNYVHDEYDFSTRKLKPPLFIAHAGGGYKKQAYLNSLEALDYNYSLGHRVFEIDFNWTKDKELVAIHDWKQTYKRLFPQADETIPNLTQFLNLKMNFEQTQISLDRLDDWLIKHSDAFIVTDVKGRNVKALKLMKETMETALKQVIPQMYHPTNYIQLRKLGYDNIIFTLYATKLATAELLHFIGNNYLYALTINPSKNDFQDIVDALGESDVFIYVHTFNKVTDVAKFKQLGVNGLYTDFLYMGDREKTKRQ